MRYDGPLARVSHLTDLGVRQAEAWCRACDHRAWLPLERFPAATVFVAIKPRLVCAACGNREVEFSPGLAGLPAGRADLKLTQRPRVGGNAYAGNPPY